MSHKALSLIAFVTSAITLVLIFILFVLYMYDILITTDQGRTCQRTKHTKRGTCILYWSRVGVFVFSLVYIGFYLISILGSVASFAALSIQACKVTQFASNSGYFLSRFFVGMFYVERYRLIVYTSNGSWMRRLPVIFWVLNFISTCFGAVEFFNEEAVITTDQVCYITTENSGVIGWIGFFILSGILDALLLWMFLIPLKECADKSPDNCWNQLIYRTKMSCSISIIMSLICNVLYTVAFYIDSAPPSWIFPLYDITAALDTFCTSMAVVLSYSRFSKMLSTPFEKALAKINSSSNGNEARQRPRQEIVIEEANGHMDDVSNEIELPALNGTPKSPQLKEDSCEPAHDGFDLFDESKFLRTEERSETRADRLLTMSSSQSSHCSSYVSDLKSRRFKSMT